MNALYVLSTLSLFVVTVNCHVSCDHKNYSSGCEDSLGSFCNQTTNRCECRPDFDVRLGDRFCLKWRTLLESCFTSEQCINNSKCFSNSTQLFSSSVQYWIRPEVPLFPEGLCVCPQTTHFLNKHNVCEPSKSMDDNCAEDSQCQQPNSVCHPTRHECTCNQTFVFSSIIGHCVQGKYLGEGCNGREECQYSEQHSWCIDGICLCGAGYTPDKSSFNGMPQCVLDSMLVENGVPAQTVPSKTEPHFDYMTLLLIVLFLFALTIAAVIARRNRNSIMQMIRPSTELNRTSYSDQSSHCMIPIDNSINSFHLHNNDSDNSCKQNLQSNKLIPNISIDLHKNY